MLLQPLPPIGLLYGTIASLKVLGGQEFHSSHSLFKFRQIFLNFRQIFLIFFLISPEKALAATLLLYECNWVGKVRLWKPLPLFEKPTAIRWFIASIAAVAESITYQAVISQDFPFIITGEVIWKKKKRNLEPCVVETTRTLPAFGVSKVTPCWHLTP